MKSTKNIARKVTIPPGLVDNYTGDLVWELFYKLTDGRQKNIAMKLVLQKLRQVQELFGFKKSTLNSDGLRK